MGDSPHRRYTGLNELFNQRQVEAKIWIEREVGERLNGENLGIPLKDGRVLCRLINSIYPGYIEKWCDTDPIPRYLMLENINAFLKRCRAVGVPEDKLFTAMDLYENKNLPLVVDCLLSLQMIVETQKEIQRNTGYFGNPSLLIPVPNNNNNNNNNNSNNNNSDPSVTTGYFPSSPHSLPPPISSVPTPSQFKLTVKRNKFRFNNFLRVAIMDFKKYVLVPLFIGMSGGLGMCMGRAAFLQMVMTCQRLFTKSLSLHSVLEWVGKLKAT